MLDCDPCEGYLEKKSPSLFIKWQVIKSLIFNIVIDQILCYEEYEASLLQKREEAGLT